MHNFRDCLLNKIIICRKKVVKDKVLRLMFLVIVLDTNFDEDFLNQNTNGSALLSNVDFWALRDINFHFITNTLSQQSLSSASTLYLAV